MANLKFVALVAALACLGYAAAECANACSGHGTCGTNDQCTCYPNWQAADCSERTCPFGLSFVDTPQGDLNHDGSVTATSSHAQWWGTVQTWEKFPSNYYTLSADEAHFYQECSNKGLCDRASGLCQCFEGYTGSSCQRTTCPNSCSGHGVCRTTGEIAVGALNKRRTNNVAGTLSYSGVQTAFTYGLWDTDKNQACVCDYGWTGHDCGLRECPRGDDPLTHLAKDCGGATCADEIQTITYTCADATCKSTLTCTFQDWTGETWTTAPIDVTAADFGGGSLPSSAGTAITTWLTDVPNSVFESVTVAASTASTHNQVFAITFTKNPGNISPLSCSVTTVAGATGTVAVTSTNGNKEESVCSNRGLCDYETGLCKCFKGYYLDDCSAQSALAM